MLWWTVTVHQTRVLSDMTNSSFSWYYILVSFVWKLATALSKNVWISWIVFYWDCPKSTHIICIYMCIINEQCYNAHVDTLWASRVTKNFQHVYISKKIYYDVSVVIFNLKCEEAKRSSAKIPIFPSCTIYVVDGFKIVLGTWILKKKCLDLNYFSQIYKNGF